MKGGTDAQKQSENSVPGEPPPLPWKQVIPLVVLQICESFNSSSIFSYVPFLVQDFTDANRDTAGTYAGLVASAVYLGSFVSSYLWGKLSDRIGKRPCLIIGSTGTLLCCLMFGFSWNLPWAITARFLAGVLNGNLGVAKSYLGAITTADNQARAFGLLSLAWGAGSLLGPSIGGFTARPAVSWPHVFGPDHLFSKFPYLLPNLITSVVVSLGLVLAILCLPEPEIKLTRVTDDTSSDESVVEKLPSVWRQPQALLACGVYIQLGFCFILFEETYPLWLTSTIASGGLAFTTSQIGLAMLQIGAWFLIVQLFIYPQIPHRIGMMNTHRLGVLIMIPVALTTPFINLVAHDQVLIWVCLVAIGFGQAFADACAFSTGMVFVNNSVDPRQFGEVNGIGQTGVALVRAIGPAIGGPLFAWSLTEGNEFPFNYWFMFCFQSVFLIWLFCYSFFLSPSVTKPKVIYEPTKKHPEVQKSKMYDQRISSEELVALRRPVVNYSSGS